MKNASRWLMTVGTLSLCVVAAASDTSREGSETVVPVSLIQLIVTPERFDGKLVRTVGFCNIERGGDAVYFHREDFESALAGHAISLDIPWPVPAKYRALTHRYVFVEGRFQAPKPDRLNIWAGRLLDVRTLEPYPSRAEMEELRRQDLLRWKREKKEEGQQ